MGCRPFVAVRGGASEEVALESLRSLADKYGLFSESVIDDGSDFDIAALSLQKWFPESSMRGLINVFEELCVQTDWHVVLDWDDLDDESDFPYKSLSRPSGAKEPVLLWPDD